MEESGNGLLFDLSLFDGFGEGDNEPEEERFKRLNKFVPRLIYVLLDKVALYS